MMVMLYQIRGSIISIDSANSIESEVATDDKSEGIR